MRLSVSPTHYSESLWRGREVLAHQRSIGFDHLGAAQQALFRFSNGFHTFVEPFDYEVVGPLTGPSMPSWHPPLVYPETSAERIARERQEHTAQLLTFKERKAAQPKRLTLAQQDARLPDLHREPGPVAATIFIKGYDKPIVPTPKVVPQPKPFTEEDEIQLEFATLLIESGKPVFLCRDDTDFRTVSKVSTLRDSFYSGWRLDLERYEKPQQRLQSPQPVCDTESPT